jgi:hypothetical protein
MNEEELAKEMAEYLNRHSSRGPGLFVQEMSKRHRTLQQLFTRVCVEWLYMMANRFDNGTYDGRDKDSAKLGHEFRERFPDIHLPLI